MSKNILVITTYMVLLMGCAVPSEKPALAELKQQVADTERAFAKTMADRDYEGFVSFLSEEAVFFSAATQLRGKQQVATLWKRYYEEQDAPFCWEPERVEVLDSGTLALSTGPVHNPEGKLIGTYTSIWQLDASGKWHIIFDKGNEVCDCARP